MTPVTGPYVGTANPVRGVAGGGLPLDTDRRDRLPQTGRPPDGAGARLVLARQALVPPALQGTNPFPDFRALVSCQSIGAGNTAAITNISTGDFTANAAGDSTINTRVSLPKPCIAPIAARHRPHQEQRLVRGDWQLASADAPAGLARRPSPGQAQAG